MINPPVNIYGLALLAAALEGMSEADARFEAAQAERMLTMQRLALAFGAPVQAEADLFFSLAEA